MKARKIISKYDYLLFFIIVAGLFFIVQQSLLLSKLPQMNETVEVTVSTTPGKLVVQNASLDNITTLYFDQQKNPVKVLGHTVGGESISFVLQGPGIFSSERKVFGGESVNVGQLVKLSGGYKGDAYITEIEKASD